MRELLRSRLAPFKHKDFRRFFFVQSLSLVGTQSHELARAWIIVEMLKSATALGSLYLAMAIPSLFLILHGGVLVDRADVRKILLITKFVLAIAAIALACVVEFEHVQLWHFIVYAVIEGVTVSFDQPAYMALTTRLVPRADFQQALAMNSMNFHTARLLGPLLAGVLMAFSGPSLVFFFDAFTFCMLFFVLWGINLNRTGGPVLKKQSEIEALKEGLLYIWRHPTLRYRILQLMVAITLIFPLMVVVFRVYMKSKFNLKADEFGFVFSIPALGSMIGALSFAVLKPSKPLRALRFGLPIVAICVALIPLMNTAELSAIMMGFAGFALYLSFASLTVSMQLDVDETYRGRLSAVIGLGFVSLGPLMGMPMGYLSDLFGASHLIWGIVVIFITVSAALFLLHKEALKSKPHTHHPTPPPPSVQIPPTPL